MPIERVWLATDLTDGAVAPWAHAMRICASAGADLRVLHVKKGGAPQAQWSQLPTPRTLLVGWGFLGEDATLADFERLGFRVRLDALEADHPVGLLTAMVEVHAPDLVVVGRRPPSVLRRLLDGSVSDMLARRSPHPTLVVPSGTRPFVEPETGAVRLARVLVPVGDARAIQAYQSLREVAHALDVTALEVVFVHVGMRADIPQLELPEDPGWTHRTVSFREGPVVGRILEAATREEVDLIAMATDGHDTLADAVWGSRTERVLQDSPVPVLVTRLA